MALALNVVAPAPACCVIVVTPLCVIAPAAETENVPEPTFEAPSRSAELVVSAALLAPLLFSDTTPEK
ncbi:MAG: hypothetical protein WDO24_06750 [Pseudomonadota bacterium]